jgi:hypothetical protein
MFKVYFNYLLGDQSFLLLNTKTLLIPTSFRKIAAQAVFPALLLETGW